MINILKKEFSFDLGGHTPLGKKWKDHELIWTVNDLLKKMNDTSNIYDWSGKLKLLPFVLENVWYIDGEEDLYDVYTENCRNILLTNSNFIN